MSKRRKFELVNTTDWPALTSEASIDWSLCILCQQTKKESLVSPKPDGYSSLVRDLTDFAEMKALPSSINLEQMNDGSGILPTLIARSAKYHKVCRNRYDSQKLNRKSVSASDSKDSVNECTSVNTRSSSTNFDIRSTCLFCESGSLPGNKLLSVCTKNIGTNICSMAVDMNDSKLLARISSTDFIALEVKYHSGCFTHFRNRYRSHQRASGMNGSDESNPNRLAYGCVITELVQHIEETYLYSNSAPVFNLSDLTKLVVNRMACLGVQLDEKSINRTRLKDHLLSMVPGLREDKSGREVLLSFDADVGDAIREACDYNDLSDGMCVAKAASILRRDMFKNFPKFTGSLTEGFGPRDCVPPSLVNFLIALLGGQNIDSGSPATHSEETAAYSIAQLFVLFEWFLNGTSAQYGY